MAKTKKRNTHKLGTKQTEIVTMSKLKCKQIFE